MDTVSIAGSSLLSRHEQTQQTLSMTIMKQAATQQNQIADMLAQSARQAQGLGAESDGNYNFSTFA